MFHLTSDFKLKDFIINLNGFFLTDFLFFFIFFLSSHFCFFEVTGSFHFPKLLKAIFIFYLLLICIYAELFCSSVFTLFIVNLF